MPPKGEQKFYIRMRIYDKQQKRDFIEEIEVVAKSEKEAKLLAFYGIRQIYSLKCYRYELASIKEGLILPSGGIDVVE